MFVFSNRSEKRSDGVKPILVACVVLALRKYCGVDYSVAPCAVRDIEQQRAFVKRGVSWTMESFHLPQEDGYSWAIDLYPTNYDRNNPELMDREFREICRAMDMAASDLGIEVEHGHYWGKKDSPHHQFV